ncbi:hypothetical protein BpHYR1_044621 [Brachionus plicatilis]|uniref:Uncharacterized protein n=1 Tax=Brachionus plicatilis TaxID=10195 RepID=A0A3M7RVB0_BRAPC|nr:hypothetical protein BpHYR1_044621 [Brachionus plicatilis]
MSIFRLRSIIIARNEPSREELNNQARPFGFGLNQFDLKGKTEKRENKNTPLFFGYNLLINKEEGGDSGYNTLGMIC